MFRSSNAFALTPFLVLFCAAFLALAPEPVRAADADSAPDSHLAAAIAVVAAADLTAPAMKMIDKMIPEVSARVHRQNPDLDETTVKTFLDEVQQQMTSSEDAYATLLAKVYERHFSEDELRALAQFYRSDIGKKYVSESPDMVGEIQRAGIAWVRAAIAKATQSAGTHFKDKGLNL